MNGKIEPGGLVLILVGNKTFLTRAEGTLHTHRGAINLGELVGKRFGVSGRTSTGETFYALRPTIFDFVMKLERRTQVIYPKDMGFIILKLGIGPGSRVIDAGAGSGASAVVLAHFVGEAGRVYTYERRPEFLEVARRNARKWGIENRIEFKLRDISQGFDEEGVDAVLLDVPTPWDYVECVKRALAPGATAAIVVPTYNQIEKTLRAMDSAGGFVGTEIYEVLYRAIKVNPDRIRPADTMVGHTAFLIFTRRVSP